MAASLSGRSLVANLAPKINLSALKKPGQERLTSFLKKIAAQLPGFFAGKDGLAAWAAQFLKQ